MRINKYIAASSALSRRDADTAIETGRVTVNGDPLTDFSYQVAEGEVVRLDGAVVTPYAYVYYAINKPVGYTCTTDDVHAEHIVTALVPAAPPVFPVGRLDRESRGLLFLTNDGDLTHELTHPSFEHEKEYRVTVTKQLDATIAEVLMRGVQLDEGLAQADAVTIENAYTLTMTLHQGWNRQIRRMLGSLSYEVSDLFRIRIGHFVIGDLHEGAYIECTKDDLRASL